MKIKIFIVSLIVTFLVIGLFILTGCGNKKEENKEPINSSGESNNSSEESNNNLIKITNRENSYVTTFDSINNKFTQKNPAYSQVDSKDLGIFISLSYKECPKSTYDYYKTHNFLGVEFSEGETKDYTWNKYSGYTYSVSETEVNFKILLECKIMK